MGLLTLSVDKNSVADGVDYGALDTDVNGHWIAVKHLTLAVEISTQLTIFACCVEDLRIICLPIDTYHMTTITCNDHYITLEQLQLHHHK